MFRHLQSCWVTIAVAVLAILAWAIPSASAGLEINFQLVADEQWWRIWTGYLTHFGIDHLCWDFLPLVESHLAGAGFGIGCYAIPMRTAKD